MFDNLFEHCHLDNPVFVYGIFWCTFLAVTYIGTLYYRYQESCEADNEAALKAREEEIARIRRQEPPLIREVVRPIDKKDEVPVVVVDAKPKKVSKAQ